MTNRKLNIGVTAYRLLRVVAGGGLLVLSVAAQQPPPPDVDSAKVVITVGDLRVTVGDLTDFAIWSTSLEEKGQAGAFMWRVLDLQAYDLVAPGGAVPDHIVAGLLLAQEGRRAHLQTSPDFPAGATPLEQADWLAKAEFEHIAAEAQNPEELQKFFSAHRSDFESIEIRTVGIRKASGKEAGLSEKDAHERADAIRKSLEAGTPFDQVRAKFEIPPTVLLKTQTVARGDWPPDLDAQLFALKDGAVIQADDKPEYIALVQAVRRIQPTLDEVKPRVIAALQHEKVSAVFESQKKRTRISVDEAYFTTP